MASWGRVEAGGLVVHHHPETKVRCRTTNGTFAILIGEAFPSPATTSVDSILDDLLRPVEEERLLDTFDSLSGRFVLLLLKGSAQRAFHDPIGSRSLFYREEGELCLGSHAELVALACGHARGTEARGIMASDAFKSRSAKYLPGDLTVYDGLRALAPNNFYDIRERRPVRYWPRRGRRPTTFDAFLGVLDEHLTALASHLGGRHRPVLGVTAGIDSRVLLSSFHQSGLMMEGLTWLRRGELKGPERDVIEALVSRAGIDHTYVDLSGGESERGIGTVAKRNVGNFGRRSQIAASLHPRFVGRDAAFVRGWGAEIIRGFYNVARRSSRRRRDRVIRRKPVPRATAISEVAPAQLLRAYNSSMNAKHPGQEYTRLALNAFEGFMQRAHYDERLASRGFDLSDIFYWEHRMGMWGSAKHNEMDPALLSLVGFNSRPLYEVAFGLDPGVRLTRELFREVVRRYDVSMADLPYL